MTTKNSIDRITEILRSSDLSWLLPNLRQDTAVWTCLNDPVIFEKFLEAKSDGSPYTAGDFSPSKLALIALGQNNVGEINPGNALGSIDPQLLQSAARRYPELIVLRQRPNDLANAGLIALALAQKYSNSKTWNDLISDLIGSDAQTWLTPLACLFGFIDEPSELLEALVQPSAGTLRYQLAIHSVLSNPLPSTGQLSTLIGLCEKPNGGFLPPIDRVRFLNELQTQNSKLAENFCKEWLEKHPLDTSIADDEQNYPTKNIEQLAEVMFQIQASELTHSGNNIVNLINTEETLTHTFYLDILNRIIVLRAKTISDQTLLGSSHLVDGMPIQLAHNTLPLTGSPRARSEMAMALVHQDQIEEALKLLPNADTTLPDNKNLLYAMSFVYHQAGADQQSVKAVSKLLEIIDHPSDKEKVPVWGEFLSLVNLGKLLVELEKPLEASKILERALQDCPNDPTLLQLLAKNYTLSNKDDLAADTYCILVFLSPDDLGYRRDFADSLEKTCQWEACLKERSIIVEPNNRVQKNISIQDLYKYAHAALKANRPDLTLVACKDILETNPEDSQALIYLGQAYVDLREVEKGIDYLQQATVISPDKPDAWLTLANAQKKVFPLKTVIDTLNNAALILGDSDQIQFTLGELYLEDNTPTLALPVLQRAYELNPKNPQILVRYGEALNILGHFEDACEVLSKAYELNPSFPGLAQTYARLLLDLGKVEDAISPLEQLTNDKSLHDPSIYMDYARCVLIANKLGSTAHPPMKALIALNEVMQIAPEIIEAKALIADVLNACGENELAYQAYRDALDTELKDDRKWFERLSFGLGCTASAIGKYDVAIAALQEASQISPNNPSIFMALSDAFLSVDLPEDAVRAARNVLVIDGNNPNNLAWFARQMTKFIGRYPQVNNYSSGSIFKQLITEILAALNKAIQLAPTRIDLLIQLGNFQSGIGSKDEATATYSSVAELEFATISDLIDAAGFLSNLAEHAAAITCLEKAVSLDIQNPDNHQAVLYKSLAHEYFCNHDRDSAISILEKAGQLIPNDNTILSLKVEILLETGEAREALDCIQTSLQNKSDLTPYVDLLFLASRINRAMGELGSTIHYAKIATEAVLQRGRPANISKIPLLYRLQIAELYRSLLQPNQAYQIIGAESKFNRSDFANEYEYLDYLCLHTELALETGQYIEADIQDVQVEPTNPAYIRLAAIKARLMNIFGDAKQATQLFQFIVNKASHLGQNSEFSPWEAPYLRYKQTNSLFEAALDLGLWEYASYFAQEMINFAKEDPLPYVNFVKYFVARAEYDHLCDLFDVVEHKPKDDALGSANSNHCLEYLERAQQVLENFHNERPFADYGINNDEILHWRARASVAFRLAISSQDDLSETLIQHPTEDDTSSLIQCLYRQAVSDPDSDAMTKIIKIARLHKNEPGVILQVAVALQDNSPDSAARTLQSVLQEKPFVKNPTTAFCKILLAKAAISLQDFKAAQQAIESALEFWSDEPRWHSLASQIYIKIGDSRSAIEHLTEASILAPMDISYHKELGRLYLDNANEDHKALLLALKCFETATKLNEQDVDALVAQATTQFLLNDLDSAHESARNALVLAPDRAELYQLLSEIAIRNNDYQGAYEYANKAIVISPNDIHSTLALAKSLSSLGRHHEAIAKLNSAIPEAQQPEMLYLERVNILNKMAGTHAALNELVILNNSYPENFDILKKLARMYAEAGEQENAIVIANQALQTSSAKSTSNEQANLHLLLGQLLRKSGQLDLSIQHLDEAIRLAPDRLEPYLELGLTRKERREYQQALQIFAQATTIAPDDPRALFQAGLALKESKDYKSSETMLRRAVSLAPNDLNIRRQLAAVVALNLVHNPRIGRS